MCDQDQDQPFIAHGFDANLHDCSVCNDTGISQEDAGYCTACRMGKRIEQLDQFAEQLKGHGFTEAIRIVYRTTQRTEKAIAAADKALMITRNSKRQWIDITHRLPEVNTAVLITDGKTIACAHRWDTSYQPNKIYWSPSGAGGHDCELDIFDEDITHWMPMPALPPSPVSKQG